MDPICSHIMTKSDEQERIPVGCVPTAAVITGDGVGQTPTSDADPLSEADPTFEGRPLL